MIEGCIPDHLLLIAMGALLWADLLAQTCDFCVDALGTPIWALWTRADFSGFCFNVLMKRKESDIVTQYTIQLPHGPQWSPLRNIFRHHHLWMLPKLCQVADIGSRFRYTAALFTKLTNRSKMWKLGKKQAMVRRCANSMNRACHKKLLGDDRHKTQCILPLEERNTKA